MFSWTVRENLETQHISSSSLLAFFLGNVSPWFLLTACAPASPLWLADFYAIQNARNIRALFTTYPLITVANNNLLFKMLRDYYMTFSISALVLARDSHIKSDSEAGGLIWVEGWLIPGTIWKISCHNLFITCFTLTFFKHWFLYCKKDLWTDKLWK